MMSYSAIEWAREHGTGFSWFCLANGYPESDRRSELYSGYGYRYANEQTQGETRIILVPDQQMRHGYESLYVIDDGKAVVPYYVGGWNDSDGSGVIYLHPFPTNYNADGTPRTRANDGRPVDFATWKLNPTRAYHLKDRG